MNRDAMLLAPHAARMQAILPAGLPVHVLLVIALLLALCAAAAVAVKLEGQR